ncbi:MAG TPA: FtsX-like permease family protein [Pirellulales bacterium]|jgi:putative ABC transport system permease protein|nr:FtsX-like permease family protein [Pirellulales bacterium]
MLSFALKTLISDRGKLLTGLAGVVFSLVLISVQGGLYLGLMRKASVLIDHCAADVWVGPPMVEDVDLAQEISEVWVDRLRGIRGVESARPYIIGKGIASLANGHMEDVWLIGSEPSSMLGTGWAFVEGSAAELRRPDGVSFDDVDAAKLGHPHVGDWLEINGHRAQIVARTHGITGFITMPYLFTTLENARRMAHITPGACSYFLLTLRPDADRRDVLAAIRRRVPEAAVYTPDEFARISRDYWMKRTGIGVSFGASTVLGLLVGLMMVGQSLYALALDHLDEYATLKALGALDRHVCGVILAQASAIAVVGSLTGLCLVAAIRQFWNSPLAPVYIPPSLMGLAVVTVVAICLAASLLPFARIRRIDPAIVLLG